MSFAISSIFSEIYQNYGVRFVSKTVSTASCNTFAYVYCYYCFCLCRPQFYALYIVIVFSERCFIFFFNNEFSKTVRYICLYVVLYKHKHSS